MLAAHRLNAKRIERALLQLQGLFIKVGQALSVMANSLPREFRDELEGMQDNVPPRPFAEIQAQVVRELGAHPSELYAYFSEVPIASASLGQVHEARLADGTRVAVKVRHANIEEIAKLDLRIIARIMSIVQWFMPISGLENYSREIRQLISEELDFKREAANIEKIRYNFRDQPNVDTPEVITRLSTSKVLTLTYVEGTKIGAIDELEREGIDREELARVLIHAYCQMVFVDGVYHADPHPGNLLVSKMADGKPKLVMIDFGAVGTLSEPMREGIPEFLEGVLRRDTERIVRAMRTMGFIGVGSDEALISKVVDYFHRQFQEEIHIESVNLRDIKFDPQRGLDRLLDLRALNVGLKDVFQSIYVPRDWVLLQRTLLLATGVCTQLAPTLNPTEIIRPYLQELVLGNRDFAQIALDSLRDTALRALQLPELFERFLRQATRGDVSVHVREMRESTEAMTAAARTFTWLVLAMALAAFAIWLRQEHPHEWLWRAFGVAAGLSGVGFLVGFLRSKRSN
jgi:predicted unusual protein kinase regulating ubiquinone biosynthesis (AarF/ABC1/UbiB family)